MLLVVVVFVCDLFGSVVGCGVDFILEGLSDWICWVVG